MNSEELNSELNSEEELGGELGVELGQSEENSELNSEELLYDNGRIGNRFFHTRLDFGVWSALAREEKRRRSTA